MPLKPNIIERFLINRGMVPGIMIDMGLPMFQLFAMLGAMEIGFFRHLKDNPADIETLAKRLNASERGVERLALALEPLGYLKKQNGKYALTKLALNMPIDKLETMAPYFRHQATVVLPEIEYGFKKAPEDGVYGWEHVKSGEVGRGYQASMRWLASSMVEQVVNKIELPGDVKSMLDVGGSHGLYTIEFCKKYPQLKGTILDWEIGLEEARKSLQENPGVSGRIELVERDFEKEELPGEFDFVYLGNIIHGLNPEGNRELFAKLSRATSSQAMVAIQDQFAGIKGSEFSRAVAGLAGLNLFLFSGGRTYEYEEIKKWLGEAGFTKSTVHKLKQPGMSLLIATKV